MTRAKAKQPAVPEGPTKEELQAKHEFWSGQVRYYKVDEGERRYFPEWVGTPYWAPEGLTRQICKGITVDGDPLWVIAPDAPAPAIEFARSGTGHSRETENAAAPSPPYDYRPPAYASDTQSGGPANFHGNAGGLDNPRNPVAEGEIPGERDESLAAFKDMLQTNAENATT